MYFTVGYAIASGECRLPGVKRTKWRKCETKLKRLRDLVEGARQRANTDAAEFSVELCRDIVELYDEGAEFTATAKACSAELQADRLVDLARALYTKQ